MTTVSALARRIEGRRGSQQRLEDGGCYLGIPPQHSFFTRCGRTDDHHRVPLGVQEIGCGTGVTPRRRRGHAKRASDDTLPEPRRELSLAGRLRVEAARAISLGHATDTDHQRRRAEIDVLLFRDLNNQVPWLGDVPVLGALFRSAEYARSQTELVIIITPHLVTPTRGEALALPTDRVQPPTERDLFLFGRVAASDAPTQGGAAEVTRQDFSGSYGYVMD